MDDKPILNEDEIVDSTANVRAPIDIAPETAEVQGENVSTSDKADDRLAPDFNEGGE